MNIEVVRPAELGSAAQASWQTMQRSEPQLANPYLAPEFAVAVGRVRRSARVAVLTDGRRGPVAFFPFERRAAGLGRPIGAGVSRCQGLVHASGLVLDPGTLLRGCRLQAWEYDHLTGGQGPFVTSTVRQVPSPVIRVDDGYAAYTDLLWRRAPGELRELRARESRLAREAGDLRFVFDERAPDVLDTLMRWHSARCRTVSRPDPFARPAVRALVSDLHDTRAEGCSGLVSALYANGRLIACTFGLRSRRVLVNRFPAYDTAFAGYSPGLLMYLMLAEGAAGRGIDRIELGRGCGEGHEEQVKSADVLLGEGRVERGTRFAGLRAKHADAVRAVRARLGAWR